MRATSTTRQNRGEAVRNVGQRVTRSPWYVIAGILLVLSCWSDSATDVTGASGHLKASTDATTALTGKVQPVPGISAGGLIAASIAGAVDVQHSGAASYRVPIWVPDGVNGLQPSLAVSYNSQSGTGL